LLGLEVELGIGIGPCDPAAMHNLLARRWGLGLGVRIGIGTGTELGLEDIQ
jgi:hypothetical protein